MNISLNKEPVTLRKGRNYILIDSLYLDDVKGKLTSLNPSDLKKDIREKVFPYTNTPFAELYAAESIFSIDNMSKAVSDDISSDVTSVFSSDTGLVLLIDEKIFIDILEDYDYDELVDSSTEDINSEYWRSLVSKYDFSDVALILSPGINAGVDFEGSGVYKVKG